MDDVEVTEEFGDDAQQLSLHERDILSKSHGDNLFRRKDCL